MFYSYLLIPQIILQIFCIMHVVRNGKDRIWIFIILFLPYFGGITYFFWEILPSLRAGGIVNNTNTQVENILFPSRRIQTLEQQLILADTYQNKVQLAEAYASAKRYDEAISLFTKALSGLYKDDPSALSKRAITHYAAGNIQAAKTDLEHIQQTGEALGEKEQLLLAIILESLNDSAAEKAFQKAVRVATGLEAEYRYALYLKNSDRQTQANEIFGYIIIKSKSSPSYFRRLEAKWLQLTKEELQS